MLLTIAYSFNKGGILKPIDDIYLGILEETNTPIVKLLSFVCHLWFICLTFDMHDTK